MGDECRSEGSGHEEIDRIRKRTYEEFDRILDNERREIDRIHKASERNTIAAYVGGVEVAFGTVAALGYGYYPVSLLLCADGGSRWIGVISDSKDLTYFGILSPVVKGIRRLNSYLRR